jgi:hypothetical protein
VQYFVGVDPHYQVSDRSVDRAKPVPDAGGNNDDVAGRDAAALTVLNGSAANAGAVQIPDLWRLGRPALRVDWDSISAAGAASYRPRAAGDDLDDRRIDGAAGYPDG